ncbi:unnamed protein product [Moneuplotes crassus]|uniref:Uncharacterized protein n=1 Tax=Euplotes crassus TaxID=5936 RepID=A0AAD1UV02_EUPCR|nr:unnamed protein product [Moneuplotes crassus]
MSEKYYTKIEKIRRIKYPHLNTYGNSPTSLGVHLTQKLSKNTSRENKIKVEDIIREGVLFKKAHHMENYVKNRIKKLSNHQSSFPSAVPLTNLILKNCNKKCSFRNTSAIRKKNFSKNNLVPLSSDVSRIRPKSTYSTRNRPKSCTRKFQRSQTKFSVTRRALSRNKLNRTAYQDFKANKIKAGKSIDCQQKISKKIMQRSLRGTKNKMFHRGQEDSISTIPQKPQRIVLTLQNYCGKGPMKCYREDFKIDFKLNIEAIKAMKQRDQSQQIHKNKNSTLISEDFSIDSDVEPKIEIKSRYEKK